MEKPRERVYAFAKGLHCTKPHSTSLSTSKIVKRHNQIFVQLPFCDRFVGSDPGSDEVVLMKILEVLKILILSKVIPDFFLPNESKKCECFHLAFFFLC